MSSESGSSSPRRARKDKEEERPRSFDTKAKSMCWANAETVPGRHPERWRKDAAGNVVCKRFFNCQGCLCFEYDHIVPFSKGGESVAENCQILQTRVNRLKSNKVEVDGSQLKNYSCDIKFTEGYSCCLPGSGVGARVVTPEFVNCRWGPNGPATTRSLTSSKWLSMEM